MKHYTFEIGKKIFEFYDLRKAKKKALELSKEINDEVLLTCLLKKENGEFKVVFSIPYTNQPKGKEKEIYRPNYFLFRNLFLPLSHV